MSSGDNTKPNKGQKIQFRVFERLANDGREQIGPVYYNLLDTQDILEQLIKQNPQKRYFISREPYQSKRSNWILDSLKARR